MNLIIRNFIFATLAVCLLFSISLCNAEEINKQHSCIPIINTNSHLHEIALRQGYTAVPLQFATNQNTLLIKGSLDHKNFGLFLLDTGSSHSEIDPKIAKIFNLKKENKSIVVGGGDNIHHQAFQSNIPILYFGNYKSHNEPFYIVDQLSKRVDKQPLIGLIGTEYLQEHQAIIDIVNKQLYLKPKAEKNKSKYYSTNLINLTLLRTGYAAQPLEKTPTNHVTLNMRVNDSYPIRFLFDTGVPFSMLSLNFANSLGLKLTKLMEMGGSGGGKMQIYQTHIKNLSAKNLISNSQDINVMDFGNVKVGTVLYGLTGLDWMQQHYIIIDIANNKIYGALCK